jgi:hypothetical protein
MQRRKPEMGKYLLWLFFRKSSLVKKYLPATKRYTQETFREFVEHYGSVFVKPVAGSRGKGILKAWRQGERINVQKNVFQPRTFQNVDEAIRYIDHERQGKAYIVQQGLELATIGGRPLDIRVMMQREKPGGKWLYSGMIAKIAGPSSIVTNVAISRGAVMEVNEALRKSLGWDEWRVRDCMNEMIQLAFHAANHFDNYLFYRELGFDMAIDKKGRLWMIEQNTAPSHPLFAHLQTNMTLYRRIQARWGKYEKARKLHSKIMPPQ